MPTSQARIYGWRTNVKNNSRRYESRVDRRCRIRRVFGDDSPWNDNSVAEERRKRSASRKRINVLRTNRLRWLLFKEREEQNRKR